MTSKQTIIVVIEKHIASMDGSYSNWYIGISNDAERRLFEEHKVSKENGKWIYRTANSDYIARDVEQYFIAKDCDGGSGGGDEGSDMVYAYKKDSHTEP